MDVSHFQQIKASADTSKFKLGRWANDDEVIIITDLLRLHKIRTYLECGTANGWTAAQACCAMNNEGVCHTWDPVDRALIPSHYLKGDNFVRHLERFDAGVGNVLKTVRGRKLIFIDGDHTGLAPSTDFKAVEPYLRVGDFVVFHDSKGEAPVAKAVARVHATHPDWRYSENNHTRRGVAVFEVV